jgi:hypothetical protein
MVAMIGRKGGGGVINLVGRAGVVKLPMNFDL